MKNLLKNIRQKGCIGEKMPMTIEDVEVDKMMHFEIDLAWFLIIAFVSCSALCLGYAIIWAEGVKYGKIAQIDDVVCACDGNMTYVQIEPKITKIYKTKEGSELI
jgi:hypothetical protein